MVSENSKVVKVVEEIFHSSLIGCEVPFRVILPENHEISAADCPVLYLLHGLFGSGRNWLELTRVTQYLAGKRMMVVLPDGGDNWYTDSATIAKNKFESFFVDEFMPAVEERRGGLRSRESRAVAGLSMGGYGALKFALKHPARFVFAGSMSGAFDAPQLTPANRGFDWENLGPSVSEAFGGEQSATRIENDLFEIVPAIHPAARLPQIYFDCGTTDGFLAVNRRLAALLTEKGVAFEYREVAGGHDWDYWDRQTGAIIEKVDQIFNRRTD